MESDLLRLILLGFGTFLVIVIWIGDRMRRRHVSQARPVQRRQPVIHESDADVASEQDDVAPAPSISMRVDDEMPREVEPLVLLPTDTLELGKDDEVSPGLLFEAHDSHDYLHPSVIDEDLPRKVLVINVVARGGAKLSGEQIQAAVKQVELVPGEMSIYHRRDSADLQATLFSMASMVEPGRFPLKRMREFETPGLTLFTQLPGVRDGMVIYSDMLFTAERLSTLLHADLQDERHHKLTKQSIEHTRTGIIEHRRQLQLLRMKRR